LGRNQPNGSALFSFSCILGLGWADKVPAQTQGVSFSPLHAEPIIILHAG